MFNVRVIELATVTYLKTLSLHATIDILQDFYEKDILTKKSLLHHIETLIDRIPSFGEISNTFKPQRSGYYAFDGTWLKYRGNDLVLLICFDVETLDLIMYHYDFDENYQSYELLIDKINITEPGILDNAKGFYLDGELSLMKHLKARYPFVPKQLCTFHKFLRASQILPFKRAKGMNKEIKDLTKKVVFAPSKEEAIKALTELKRYAQVHDENRKIRQIIGVLRRNFDLLTTHFDHPEMSPYNNTLEGFNHIIKRRLNLMKGFKKDLNIDRWLKLILLDYRFHKIRSSKLKYRNGKSPLQLACVNLPKYYNWIKFLRKNVNTRS